LDLQLNDTFVNTFGILVGCDICITSSPKFYDNVIHVHQLLALYKRFSHFGFESNLLLLLQFFCFAAPRVPDSNYGAA